jgi:hypothetical protein
MIKKILDIKDTISLWADDNQYVVRIFNGSDREGKHAQHLYCSTFADCFQSIYEVALRKNLTAHVCKDIHEVAEIARATKKEIMEIMAPFIKLDAELGSPARPGGGR